MTYRLRHHRLLLGSGGALLAVYVLAGAFLAREPFPFFDWALYGKAQRISERYEIRIVSLKQGQPLDPPVLLSELKREYKQDWRMTPQKLVARFGRQVRGGADAAQLALSKGLVENYLREYDHAEYELLLLHYDPLQVLAQPDAVQTQTLGRFVMQREAP